MARPKQWEKLLHQGWGENLRRARKRAGLNQAQLARKLRINQGRVSEWERGDRVPNDAMKFKLARALDCALIDLFAWPIYLPPESDEAAA